VFSKARIEALSDGLFAIALTLLVLDIKVPVLTGIPHEHLHEHLREELIKDASAWFSFGVTFFLGSMFWVDHHRVLHSLAEVTKPSLMLNFVFLACVSVLPFSTSLWGHYLGEPLAQQVYFSNEMAIAVTLFLELEVASRRGEIKQGTDTGPIRFRLVAMSLMLGTTVLSTIFLPIGDYGFVMIAAVVITRLVRKRWKKNRALLKAQTELAAHAE
jgi:uncharacterized membrane protein